MGKVLVVFTAKNAARLEDEGGSAHWALSERNAHEVRYVICTRNSHVPEVGEQGTQSEVAHRAAFLVGRVSGVEKTKITKGRQRYIMKFDEVADVLVEDFWDGSRVPTRYLSEEEVTARGIRIDQLKFRPVVNVSVVDQPILKATDSIELGFTIAEAKKGIAIRFGLLPEQIDIVIRG